MALYEWKQKTDNLRKFSYFLFVISLLIFIALFIFNINIENKIQDLDNQVIEINKSTKILKEDRNIQTYILLEKNKKLLQDLEKKSQITKFISHLDEIQDQYWIIFDWFNYNNWIVSTQVNVPFSSNTLASSKVSYFIKNYRASSWSLFDLEYINSFNWADNIVFNVNFKIK